MSVNPKDVAAGAIFIAIGLFFALNALFNLRIGQTFSMGPGYFPLVLGAILVAFGVAIAAMAVGKPADLFGKVPWRGIALVVVAIVFFAVTVRGLGLALALGGATMMAALSTRKMSVGAAAILSVALTAFCIAVFIYALGLPYPVIGPWLVG